MTSRTYEGMTRASSYLVAFKETPMNNRNGMGNNEGTNVGTGGIDKVKESVRGLVDHGQEKVGQIKDKVVDVKDQAVTRGNEYLGKVTDYIRGNPLKAVGIAFGVGYIGMRLFRR